MDKLIHLQHIDSSLTLKLQPLLAELTYEDYVVLILLFAGAVAYLSYGKLWAKPDPYLYKLYERPQEQFGATTKDETSRNIARQLIQQNKDTVIFWGSQSGTAEQLAHRLARDCNRRFGLNVLVADLSDYEHDTIPQIPESKIALFLVSTYGEGDPSDNTCEFLTWIRKASASLSNIRYAAFGLGNSNYMYYNKVVDDVVESLDKLGAKSLLPIGKADDANSGTEEDFASWRDDLFAMFHSKLGFEEHIPEYIPTIQITDVTSAPDSNIQLGEPQALKLSRKAARDYSAIKQLPLKEARILTRGPSGRNCLHFEVDIRSHPQIKYKTGDHLAIWPTNSTLEVERIVNILGLTSRREQHVSISSADGKTDVKIPKLSTISTLFKHYLEISSPVSRDTVTNLSLLASTAATRGFLQGLSNKTTYSSFVARNHVTFARLLEHTILQDPSANWSHLPLTFVIESLRPMTPRYYSISSSSMISPRQMAITVAVSPAELPENPAVTIPGLSTSFLSELDITSSPNVYAHVRRSAFKMPFLHKTPIVLVAAGTGIAPFRGFLQERAQMAQVSNQEIGPVLLVFGCRDPEQDYLYREEIDQLQKGPLKGKVEVVTAFSRVVGQRKCYVQDRISEPAVREKIVQMLCQDEGNLYFCGSTTMAKTAGRRVVEAVQEHQQGDDADGKAWMDTMKRSRRWQEDVWG